MKLNQIVMQIAWFCRNYYFLDRFSCCPPPPSVPNFAEIRPEGTALMHAVWRTNMTGLIHACQVYAKSPKTTRFVKMKNYVIEHYFWFLFLMLSWVTRNMAHWRMFICITTNIRQVTFSFPNVCWLHSLIFSWKPQMKWCSDKAALVGFTALLCCADAAEEEVELCCFTWEYITPQECVGLHARWISLIPLGKIWNSQMYSACVDLYCGLWLGGDVQSVIYWL